MGAFGGGHVSFILNFESEITVVFEDRIKFVLVDMLYNGGMVLKELVVVLRMVMQMSLRE